MLYSAPGVGPLGNAGRPAPACIGARMGAGVTTTSRDGGAASASGMPLPWRADVWVVRLCAWCAAWPWALPVAAAALGVVARLWLVARTNAMIDGDEAMVGLQALGILHGQFPTYFPGQAYMAATDAYLAAPLVALLGPTGWALRLVPVLLSPLLVLLTARLAWGLLPRGAAASPLLAGLAACVAGVPPLYVAVTEMRTWGGQLEVYVVTLALLLAVVELADRLRAGVAARRLAPRWLWLGLLVGLGIWINPLIVYALIAGLLWLVPPLLGRLAPGRFRLPGSGGVAGEARTWRPAELAPLLALLPGLALGGLPAWIYAAQNHGTNLLVYVSQPQVDLAASGAARHGRLFLGAAITVRYFTCVAPNVLDGRLPTEPAPLLPLRLLLLAPPLLGLAGAAWALRRRAPDALWLGLALLYAGAVTAVFCLGTSAWASTKACSADLAGRYAVPLGLVEPLLLLGLVTAPAMWQAWRARGRRPDASSGAGATWSLTGSAVGFAVAVLLVAGLLQGATYALASPSDTFQSPYYHAVPEDASPLLAYLAREHIQAAWCNHWLGNIVTYRTAEATTCADYYDQVVKGGLPRPPGTLETVAAADRPSFILTLREPHPCLARELDAQGIHYTLARFPGGVVVITPERTVDPTLVLPGLAQDFSSSTFTAADCTLPAG
jgi:4-amino-4-deoxy-L-arabinose transferase-like glycosyltransferase